MMATDATALGEKEMKRDGAVCSHRLLRLHSTFQPQHIHRSTEGPVDTKSLSYIFPDTKEFLALYFVH